MNYLLSDVFNDEANIIDWSDFWIKFGDFLDDFKRDPDVNRLEKEPEFSDPLMSSFLAASIDHLSYINNLPVPVWTRDKKYILKDPFFPCGFKGLYKLFLLVESPPAYKIRNIFVESNVLTRV